MKGMFILVYRCRTDLDMEYILAAFLKDIPAATASIAFFTISD
jgi:hypothetical protein